MKTAATTAASNRLQLARKRSGHSAKLCHRSSWGSSASALSRATPSKSLGACRHTHRAQRPPVGMRQNAAAATSKASVWPASASHGTEAPATSAADCRRPFGKTARPARAAPTGATGSAAQPRTLRGQPVPHAGRRERPVPGAFAEAAWVSYALHALGLWLDRQALPRHQRPDAMLAVMRADLAHHGVQLAGLDVGDEDFGTRRQ